MKVCLITAFNHAYADIADITLAPMKLYCDRHGYGLEIGHYREDPNDLMNWGDRGKWGLFQSWFDKYDIIMWLDVDTLIMNHDIRVEAVIPRNVPFIWTHDYSGPCSGFWIARTTPQVAITVNKIRDEAVNGRDVIAKFADNPKRTVVQFEPYGASDQATMIRLMNIPPHNQVLQYCVPLKEAGHCFDFRALGVPEMYDYIGNYEPGDWLYTIPSLPLPERTRLLAAKAVEFYDALPSRDIHIEHHRDVALAASRGEPAPADA